MLKYMSMWEKIGGLSNIITKCYIFIQNFDDLCVCLESAYFAEIKNFLLKVL